jgi:predicted GIY-YIG superfamily endonuclease
MATRKQKPRPYYKYDYKVKGRIVHSGITDDLERRAKEHERKYGKGQIIQVGRRTTEEAAREWEKTKRKS